MNCGSIRPQKSMIKRRPFGHLHSRATAAAAAAAAAAEAVAAAAVAAAAVAAKATRAAMVYPRAKIARF